MISQRSQLKHWVGQAVFVGGVEARVDPVSFRTDESEHVTGAVVKAQLA